jgi:hypothetical protein
MSSHYNVSMLSVIKCVCKQRRQKIVYLKATNFNYLASSPYDEDRFIYKDVNEEFKEWNSQMMKRLLLWLSEEQQSKQL